MDKEKKRFTIKYEHIYFDFKENNLKAPFLIIVDTETGVNYIAGLNNEGCFNCLTPLLDSEGKIVIDK